MRGETRRYQRNGTLGFWQPQAPASSALASGDALERDLLASLEQCRDLSSSSDELRQYIVDWPTEYHLSPARHNLLRPLRIGGEHRVLEFDCGCGALTRYLGETCKEVVAVESSVTRAAIAAERCRDLPNVRIYGDTLMDFASAERFDFVCLIGVLEHAPVSIPGADPVGECLRIARHFLAPHGQLILAIENQMGLKYFNGCREDHFGERYFGLHDLYREHQPITFGRRELAGRLAAAGFEQQRFYYPFPDYKLPTLIMSDQAMLDPELRPADMLCRTSSRDRVGQTRCNFSENLAWQALARNGLMADLANSFLVLAAPGVPVESAPPSERWLASSYTHQRQARYAIETLFVRSDEGLTVSKRRLMPPSITACADSFVMHRPSEAARYVQGRLYLCELQRLLASDGTLASVADWARPWLDALQAQSNAVRAGELLPNDWLDAIPANFVRKDDGTLQVIDTEWFAVEPVPISWVVVRGLINSFTACPVPPALAKMSFRELIDGSLHLLSHPPLGKSAYQRAAELEDELALLVYGPVRGVPHLTELLERPLFSFCAPPSMEDEVATMLASRSWRLTAPLRIANAWFTKLTGG